MYEIPEIQDYQQKWLEAERDLAINWVEPPTIPLDGEPIDKVDRDTERVNKSLLTPRKLEDYQPGATQAHVIGALKKVVKSRRSAQRNAKQPAPTS